MIWGIIVIIAIVVVIFVIARRLPDARKKLVETKVSEGDISLYGLIAQADEAFEQKNYEEAEKLYVKSCLADPDNCKIYSRLGAIYLEQKNYYDARDAFLQAVKIEPELASRHINLGLAFLGLKDYFKATESFKKALDLDSKNKKYRKLYEKAQKLYDKEKKVQKN